MLNDLNIEESKFTTRKWYVIDSQTASDKYNQNNSIKFEAESIKLGDETVTLDNDTDVAFINCAPFFTCKTEINDVLIDEANHIYIASLCTF